MVKFKPLNVKPIKDKGTYVFGDFSIGLYYLDTPRMLGEQLASLALVGGQNIWTEKGALVPQYGYNILGKLPDKEQVIAVSKDTASSANFFIITIDENTDSHFYLYTASQGLKKYKSNIGAINVPIIAHDGKNLIVYNDGASYLFGSYYADASNIIAIDSDVPYRDYNAYYEFTVPLESTEYYWNGKEIVVTNNSTNHHMVVSSVSVGETNTVIRAIIDGEHKQFSGETATISENTLLPIDFIYYPEDYDETLQPTDPKYVAPVRMTPALIESAQNRLFVVDETGTVYYSSVGGVDELAGGVKAFDQKNDAGFFTGFYKDSSKILSIEDFMDGILISKENGLYYLTLGDATYNVVQTEGRFLSLAENQIKIRKIANIGQQYAGDHVIVKESVLAYDSNSGTIVNAASMNVFGSLVAGDIIIDSAALNAYNSGITASKRVLTYNGQENVFILYYGEDLTNGVVLTPQATLFPRKLDIPMFKFIGFNQGVVGIGLDGEITQDFKIGTIIKSLPAFADFEAIGVRDNRVVTSSLLEVTELNGVEFTITTKNTGTSVQNIKPNLNLAVDNSILPPLLYSDKTFDIMSDSYELTSRWADKKASVTRIAAPMSGRDGISLSIEFPANSSFCLAALRLPDFSLGEL